ncbi:MAG: FkbM family methyltransferase [Burkholderiales bacterium]|nr:FkbM family methyltransferase [Burkholderiales bacterium]
MSIIARLLKSFASGNRLRELPTIAGAPQARLTLEAYEALNPTQQIPYADGSVIYVTPNRYTSWRVTSFFEKEPDTLAWITTFQSGDVLVDVGANVGMYSIWAAKTRGVRVFAFEPESQNYALLNKNIFLNGLSTLVMAYCCALSDEHRFSTLFLSAFMPGGSCHTFGQELDFNLQPLESAFTQGCYSVTLDELVLNGAVPVPNHIKIDVDGLEHKVLAGCQDTLRNSLLRSVLVEINQGLPEHRAIVEQMVGLGFSYDDDQVNTAVRKEGAFKGVGNYVFQR